MTVTKRKQPTRESLADPNAAPLSSSGVKASCDSCSADITHSVHVRCAETVKGGAGLNNSNDLNGASTSTAGDRLICPDFDLCVPCFLAGKQVGPHRAHHAYRIISSHSFPIFTQDWGADEELLLIEGAEMYGLGNWADMAENVGGRTKEECEEHYTETYLRSKNYPLPATDVKFDMDQDTFQVRKKQRLEEMQAKPLTLPPPKPLASAPTCHEVAGFMPGRLEFETEYENEAETLVKDMEFGRVYQLGGDEQPGPPAIEASTAKVVKVVDGEEEEEEEEEEEKVGIVDEPEEELELKLAVLEMFNEKYDRRVASKDLIFDRGLMNYKTLLANERKKTKEERDLVLRAKVFSRIETGEDHEIFVDGLLYEMALRKRITELQEYRRNGVTSKAEGDRYDHAKSQRVSAKQAHYRDSVMLSYERAAARQNRPPSSNLDRSNSSSSNSKLTTRPTTSSLTLANSSSLHLLTVLEQQLCSTLRILPRPYLFLKEALLREWTKNAGKMGLREAKKVVVKGDKEVGGEWGEKIERVWEFLVETGGLRIQWDLTERVEAGEGKEREGSVSMLMPAVTSGGVVEHKDTNVMEVVEANPVSSSAPPVVSMEIVS